MTETSTVPSTPDRFCIIGAGPAGLAMASAFRERGVPYDHFERHSATGGLWDLANEGTPMYRSAHFISSKTMSALPGFPMPGSYPDYPRREQVLAYLRAYAAHHRLEENIRFRTQVDSVAPQANGALVTFRPADAAPDDAVQAQRQMYRGVVCASGVNWHPAMPTFTGSFAGELRHSATYTEPQELDGKRVLIVGLGNSGADIACDAAQRAKAAYVSVRRGYHFIPKHILGQPADVFAHKGPALPLWLEQPLFGLLQRWLIGDTQRLGMPKPDHQILQSHPLMNDQLLHHLRHGDVELRPDVAGLQDSEVTFADGTSVQVDLILCATGYTRSIAYLDPAFLEPGQWAASHFLTCFSRRYPSLFTLGFAELNGALYPHLGRVAALVARVAEAQLSAPAKAAAFHNWAKTARPDLTGGRKLIKTMRHAHYCDDHALKKATEQAFRYMDWPIP